MNSVGKLALDRQKHCDLSLKLLAIIRRGKPRFLFKDTRKVRDIAITTLVSDVRDFHGFVLDQHFLANEMRFAVT